LLRPGNPSSNPFQGAARLRPYERGLTPRENRNVHGTDLLAG
jgi:hypothetical protein